MKRILYILLTLFALSSCTQDKYEAHVTDLRLVSVDPKNGYPGDLVTLLGRNFSTEVSENTVKVGGVRARVLEAYKDKLLVIMPENEPGTYTFSVEAPSGAAEGLDFNYLRIPDKEYLVSTIVGQQGVRKCVDGVGTGATTYMPTGINKAPDGTLWFTDRGGCKIRHIAKDMTVTTEAEIAEAGSAPWQGAFDADGNYWYNDKAKGKLYRFNPSSRKNDVMATGLNNPMNVAIGPDNAVYVACRNEKKVYRFDPATMDKSLYAEIPDGGPSCIGFDPKGNLVVAVHNGYRLISIASDGTQTTILGNGEKTGDVLNCLGFDFAPDGTLYVSDASLHCLKKVVPDPDGDYSKGTVETVVGGTKGYADGKGLNAKFNEPDGVLVYDESTIYVCDVQNCLIRKIVIK